MRDAIPQHEIDAIVKRLAAGEPLEQVQASLSTIAPSWFSKNGRSLLQLAGRAPPPEKKADPASAEEQPTEAKPKKPRKPRAQRPG